MDFTQEEEIKNPSSKFLEWETHRITETVQLSGGKTTEVKTVDGGYFQYWDKEEKCKKEIQLPLKFVVLNSNYSTIKGFNNERYKGIYANEVDALNFPNDVQRIKIGGEQVMEYKIKDRKLHKKEIQGLGGKYTKSIYIMLENEEIVNLQLNGASLTGAQEIDKVTKKPVINDKNDGWISFEKMNSNVFKRRWVEINTTKLKSSEMGEYTIPVFTIGQSFTEEEKTKAINAANKLKAYLSTYCAKNREEVAVPLVTLNEEN